MQGEGTKDISSALPERVYTRMHRRLEICSSPHRDETYDFRTGMDISAGTVFGPYKVLEKIGSGGMGEVYRAVDTRLEREVALKLVSDSFLGSELGGASPTPAGTPSGTPHSRAQLSHGRFLREARAAATLNHPNICAIHDVGEQNGRPYLVMELLHGETLKVFLSHHSLSATEVLALGQQAAGALAAAHAKGIVHRDIKPANLFVVESGRERRQLKILDFGLAKKQGLEASPDSRYFDPQSATATGSVNATDLTIPGSTVGTAAYMSPEQAKGDPLDARTDLFSLGSVLYEMATGQPAFGGRSTAEVFAALLMRDPPAVSSVNPAMPAALDPIIAKLLAKDRLHRYASAENLLADLEAIQGASSSSTRVASAPSSPSIPIPAAVSQAAQETGKGSGRWIAIGGLAVAVLAAGFFLLRGQFGTKPGAETGAAKAAAGGTKAGSLKDAIIVADFVNKTGDPVFDATLNQALRVQLGQSPVLDIVSQQHLRQSLQYLGRKQDEVITPQIAREIGEREAQ